MVKHTQTIRRLLPTNRVSVFDPFVGFLWGWRERFKSAKDSGIPEIPWIVVGFFCPSGDTWETLEYHGLTWAYQDLSIFKLIVLISYLLNNSPPQNIKKVSSKPLTEATCV